MCLFINGLYSQRKKLPIHPPASVICSLLMKGKVNNNRNASLNMNDVSVGIGFGAVYIHKCISYFRNLENKIKKSKISEWMVEHPKGHPEDRKVQGNGRPLKESISIQLFAKSNRFGVSMKDWAREARFLNPSHLISLMVSTESA